MSFSKNKQLWFKQNLKNIGKAKKRTWAKYKKRRLESDRMKYCVLCNQFNHDCVLEKQKISLIPLITIDLIQNHNGKIYVPRTLCPQMNYFLSLMRIYGYI